MRSGRISIFLNLVSGFICSSFLSSSGDCTVRANGSCNCDELILHVTRLPPPPQQQQQRRRSKACYRGGPKVRNSGRPKPEAKTVCVPFGANLKIVRSGPKSTTPSAA